MGSDGTFVVSSVTEVTVFPPNGHLLFLATTQLKSIYYKVKFKKVQDIFIDTNILLKMSETKPIPLIRKTWYLFFSEGD